MRLKYPFFVSAFLLLSATVVYADQFCDGFERGYITGYKRASGSSLDPIPPICPIQPIKRLSDPDSDFEHGYIIGIERGMVAASQR
jgi:hypothetical protein